MIGADNEILQTNWKDPYAMKLIFKKISNQSKFELLESDLQGLDLQAWVPSMMQDMTSCPVPNLAPPLLSLGATASGLVAFERKRGEEVFNSD